MSRAGLIVEFLILFVAIPVGYRLSPRLIPALPVLWVAAVYCWWTLRRDPAFDQKLLWNGSPLAGQLPTILPLFLLFAAVCAVCVRYFAPELLFRLPRTHPWLWAVVMVAYPVLSVYPQGIIYRAFLLHRYAGMVPSTLALVLVSACAFAFMHIVFRNPLAVVLTFLGGVIFAWRYAATGSLLTSSVEHALYGCWLFTVGLGEYFYHAAPRPH